jgi:hypothetical protein
MAGEGEPLMAAEAEWMEQTADQLLPVRSGKRKQGRLLCRCTGEGWELGS